MLAALTALAALIGAWVASAVAAYHHVSLVGVLLAVSVVLLLLPFGLVAAFGARGLSGGARLTRALTGALVVTVLFVVGAFVALPNTVSDALAVRGDWMLDRDASEVADIVRGRLLGAADRASDWAGQLRPRRNPFAIPRPIEVDNPQPPPPAGDKAPGRGGLSEHYARWLLEGEIAPVVTQIPAVVETDYASVARYIASRVANPFERVKAVHDYIADRIAYKADFTVDNLPPYDPKTVFDTKIAVCSGYSYLFVAMMKVIGQRAVYITGESRFGVETELGLGHAWNAVEIGGHWYQLDITWDAGHLDGGRFIKSYRTDYLLPPADLFGLSHWPTDPRWQLLETPLTHGEFLRQPLLWPRFFAYGFGLVSPLRAEIDTGSSAEFVVDVERGYRLLASAEPAAGGASKRCTIRQRKRRATIRCRLPASGRYLVKLYGGARRAKLYRIVARFEVNNSV